MSAWHECRTLLCSLASDMVARLSGEAVDLAVHQYQRLSYRAERSLGLVNGNQMTTAPTAIAT